MNHPVLHNQPLSSPAESFVEAPAFKIKSGFVAGDYSERGLGAWAGTRGSAATVWIIKLVGISDKHIVDVAIPGSVPAFYIRVRIGTSNHRYHRRYFIVDQKLTKYWEATIDYQTYPGTAVINRTRKRKLDKTHRQIIQAAMKQYLALPVA